MKTIKDIPNSTLTAADAEQAFMLISGIAERADYADKIAYTTVKQYITQQLAARVTTIEGSLGTISGGLSGIGTPVGVISMWYGADNAVPGGWVICNGQTVNRSDGSGQIATPDLRDRVVMGAGSILAQGATGGAASANATTASAGAHTHTLDGGGHAHTIGVDGTVLTIDQMPVHQHRTGLLDDTIDYNRYPYGQTEVQAHNVPLKDASSNQDLRDSLTSPIGGGQAHSHTASITGAGEHGHNVSNSGDHTHTVSVSTIQPAIGLHYIMKV